MSCTVLKVTSSMAPLRHGCPQMCVCLGHIKDNNTLHGLSVDCVGRDLNESILIEELDLLLSPAREDLVQLNISNTPLSEVPMSVCQLTNLSLLILNNNRFLRLPDNCFTNMTALLALSAENNSITELQDGLFDGLNSLQALYLRYNMIASIGLRVFSNPNDLVNLKTIVLDNNRLRSLEPWPYIRGLHGSADSKVLITIWDNLISKFTNNIRWQFNCSHRSYAYLSIQFNYIKHFSDIANGWNFTLDQYLCLLNLRLEVSNLSLVYKYNFNFDYTRSYDYHCDCLDVSYLSASIRYVGTYINYFKNVMCKKPLSLANRTVSGVQLSEFVCEMSDRCPPSCRCVNRPVNCTIHVYCSAANLSSLPLDLPPLPKSTYSYKLDFSNNKLLRRLEHHPYLVNTSVLDVSNCAIDFVDLNAWREFAAMPTKLYGPERLFPNHHVYATSRVVMPRVFLHGNRIESLSFAVTGVNLTSVQLTLNDNPWRCSCDNRWMIAWFRYLSLKASSNVGDVLCESPSRLRGRSVIESDEVDFCVDPLKRMLTIVLSSTMSVVASLIMLGFALHCLRVRLYKRWKFHPFDRDECAGEDMDYDVFLCCSSDDNTPHGLLILQLVEAKGYRVCYHVRDFLAGGPITENMMQSVARSKRTVCFVSRYFLQR